MLLVEKLLLVGGIAAMVGGVAVIYWPAAVITAGLAAVVLALIGFDDRT